MTRVAKIGALVIGLVTLAGFPTGSGAAPAPARAGSATPIATATAADLTKIVEQAIAEQHLRSAIVRVTVGGKNVLTRAWGESMTGVPATTRMHFRNGAVAIPYMSTLLLELVDEGKVSLDDKLARWLPEIPSADLVTLGQLAAMTAGYHDYQAEPEFGAAIYADPFRQWTPEELVKIGTTPPLWYPPGTNWNYSHTDYVILGLALEKITGQPLAVALRDRVLRPLGLRNTTDNGGTPAIPEPALHAFTSERRAALGIPAGTSFYEESSYWNPSWTLAKGAIQTTDIVDLDKTAIGVGTGKLLSKRSYAAMVSTAQRAIGSPVEGCATCRRGNDAYTYGLGIVIKGDWLQQNPLFGGYGAVMGYLPDQEIAVSVAITLDQDAFSDDGDVPRAGSVLWSQLATAMAPDQAPPG